MHVVEQQAGYGTAAAGVQNTHVMKLAYCTFVVVRFGDDGRSAGEAQERLSVASIMNTSNS